MTNTISVATAQGWKQFPVMHKNGALQVVEVPTQDTNVVFYNTVHDNGFRLPETDTDVFSEAIKICNWSAENFSELAKEDLNIIDVSEFRKEQFREQLWKFRFEMFENQGDDDDLLF